jgi:hypothetical protein
MSWAIDVSPNVSFAGQCVDIFVVIKAVEVIFELKERVQMFAMNPEMF